MFFSDDEDIPTDYIDVRTDTSAEERRDASSTMDTVGLDGTLF